MKLKSFQRSKILSKFITLLDIINVFVNFIEYSRERAAIAQAFDEYKQKTCIRFVPKLSHHYDYVYIKTNTAFGLVSL